MLTVGNLIADCGLELVAGAEGAERPIRWVHISELEDPTPWLSGGELLLTTGIQLSGAARQRRFVELLADHEVAGLGLGTGFQHKRMPKALMDEADKRGMPLFEVPYEMPFIAITERAFALLVNEQYAIFERGAQVHERLERLVIEGRGLKAVLGSLASAIGGSAIVQDAGGPRACAPLRQGRTGHRGTEGPRRRGVGAQRDLGPDPVRATTRVARRPCPRGPGAGPPRRRSRRVADRRQPARPIG